ncbi:MAG: tetratricopeptide repeat protein, partial [Bryobacteraceae bacterium]
MCILAGNAVQGQAHAAQTPVYVNQFQESGDLALFPDLGRFLTYAVRLRLGQIPFVQMALTQKGPCEIQGPRGSSSQNAENVAPLSAALPAYTVRGSIDTHGPGQAADPEVLVGYELLKSPGCKVISSHTEKFALSAVLETFGSIGEKLATDLNGDLRPRIRVDLFPVAVKGGGKNGSRAAGLLMQYLTIRLSGVEGVDLQYKQANDEKLTAQYGVRPEIVFAANGRTAEGRVEVLTAEKVYPPATRVLELQGKNGEEAADFALDLATAAAGDFSRIRTVRQSGVDKISDSDPASLLRAALALLCDPMVQTAYGCSPQPREALAALGKIRKTDVSLEARELSGRANLLIGKNSEAAAAFEEALKLPEAGLPEKRLPLLNAAAGAWYALRDYPKAGERYEEYFTLGRAQQAALPAVWARMPEACVNWSHTALLAGGQLRALEILLKARDALGDRAEFQTEMGTILQAMPASGLEAAIEKMAAALPPNDQLLGWTMTWLGESYEYGTGIAQDYAMARRWYERGTVAGNARACFDLGFLYESGHGVVQDYGKAREWFEKAAAAGDPWAMNSLGILYNNGFGVTADYATARQWYERAA